MTVSRELLFERLWCPQRMLFKFFIMSYFMACLCCCIKGFRCPTTERTQTGFADRRTHCKAWMTCVTVNSEPDTHCQFTQKASFLKKTQHKLKTCSWNGYLLIDFLRTISRRRDCISEPGKLKEGVTFRECIPPRERYTDVRICKHVWFESSHWVVNHVIQSCLTAIL